MEQKYFLPWKIVVGVIVSGLILDIIVAYLETKKRGQLTLSIVISFVFTWLFVSIMLIVIKKHVDKVNEK